MDHVERNVHAQGLAGRETELYMHAVREALSNALAHRDYELPGLVTVRLKFPKLEIVSPGGFPRGGTWEGWMNSEPNSAPTAPAIALYLATLRAAENIGRGFEVYRRYQQVFGESRLSGRETGVGPSLSLKVLIEYVPAADAVPVAEQDPRPTEGESAAPAEARTPDEQTTEFLKPPPPAGPVAAVVCPKCAWEASHHDAFCPNCGSPLASESLVASLPQGHPEKLGDFEILSLIGEGGAGSVYRALDPSLGRMVAIKTLFQRFGSTTQRERFKREAQSAARLSHPGIVPVYQIGEEKDYFYIVMEYVPGPTLDQVIRSRGPSPVVDAVQIVVQVAEALAAAHSRGVVHRDVKPANIIIDDRGNARITDFGLAQVLETQNTNLTQPGAIIGTPAYMSPEQMKGEEVDERTDIYSLGVVLYELLTGKPPFEGSSTWHMMRAKLGGELPALGPSVPEAVSGICQHAMEVEPGQRYASVSDLADALLAWSSEDMTSLARDSWWRRWTLRR